MMMIGIFAGIPPHGDEVDLGSHLVDVQHLLDDPFTGGDRPDVARVAKLGDVKMAPSRAFGGPEGPVIREVVPEPGVEGVDEL
jgi:hypothetical protein